MKAQAFPFLALALVSWHTASACAPRPDPRLDAAQDFQRTTWALIERDQQQSRKLAGLRIGMFDTEVLGIAGPPSRRETVGSRGEHATELWTYSGELKSLGILTFEDQRLVQIQMN